MLGRGPSATVAGSPWLAGVAGRTALGRLGEADDIAQVIVALHAMGWVTGQVVECDGGLSLHSPIDSYGEMLRPPRPAAPERRGRCSALRRAPCGRSPSQTMASRSQAGAPTLCAAA